VAETCAEREAALQEPDPEAVKSVRAAESPSELRVLLSADGVATTRTVLIRQPAAAPASTAVEQLAEALRETDGASLDPFDHVLRSERLDQILEDDMTLVAQGVDDGDTLVLVPRAHDQPPGASWHDVYRADKSDEGDSGPSTTTGAGRRAASAGAARAGGSGRQIVRRAIALAIVAGGVMAVLVLRNGGNSSGSIAPRITSGRYVQLASFRDRRNAERFARHVRARRLHPRVIDSDDVENLYPAWQVVAIGPLPSSSAQREMIRKVHHAGLREALARNYLAATTLQSARQQAGSYAGMVTRTDPRRPKRSGRFAVTVVLEADGHGTIRYRGRACAGKLAASSTPATALVWSEQITSGPCERGGHWTMKLYDRRLVMLWRGRGEEWVFGRLRSIDASPATHTS
jgi:hypothetical protein